ncbi:PREDICTED: cytochrome P450 3A9-like, partial [Rhagoletis zephyria]|uniref:cytochrome P450 3A9-like n=1 Tax=Rhagoletis zephyria TaxID=28612 RepID=UPI0008115D7F
MEYWTIALQVIVALLAIYYYINRRYSFWTDRGVPGPKPKFLVGNFLDLFLYGQVNMEKKWAAKYGKSYGIYQGLNPVYTILEPELVKTVLVKDFPTFVNRQVNLNDHEILALNLFNSEDVVWRRIRAITSPSFTSGKLKGMHGLMNKSVDKLCDYFSKAINTDSGNMNIKEVAMGFTIDVIASTSFGTETNANDDRSKKNPFLENGVKVFDFNFFRFVLLFLLPKKFNKWINNETGGDPKVMNFFIDLSREIIKQRRRQTGAKRNDLVQLMMDAFVYDEDLKGFDKLETTEDHDHEKTVEKEHKTGSIKRSLSENEIIAQCIIFFLAGFETTGTTIANVLYNLALNPDAQERLHSELEMALEGVDENSSEHFDIVNGKIPYLEAVIKETLRMTPPVPRLQRRVGTDTYKLNGVTLPKDVTVEVAVYAIHHSDEYYPEPSKFNPDRFMPENKHKLVPYTYLPFGAGPRNCVGMRFAYQELRLCLAKIVRQYKFAPTAETEIPMVYNKIGIVSAKNIQLQ